MPDTDTQNEVRSTIESLRSILDDLDKLETTPEVARAKTRALAELSKAEARLGGGENMTIEVVYVRDWRTGKQRSFTIGGKD